MSHNPRQAAAYPDHGSISIPETAIMAAVGQFFDQYVFGHDRAVLIACSPTPAPTATPAPPPQTRTPFTIQHPAL